MRGKRQTYLGLQYQRRITPAGAGKTDRPAASPGYHWDHPRRCGENVAPMSSISAAPGSPPQVRGKRIAQLHPRDIIGITPAGAGKTTLKSIKTAQTKDHPRRCGENALGASAACRCAGSPPQVRGKLGDLTSNFIFSRITPAGAGKTFLCVVFHFVSHGSPPQVRGKLTVHTALRRSRRITPADAGKTTASPSQRHSSQDHPRGCGENIPLIWRLYRLAGSPPRMRGKQWIPFNVL